jgi:hypothetical protein
MSFGVAELGFQECVDEVPGHRRSRRSAAHAKNVHVIVPPLPAARKVIVHYGYAKTPNLVDADQRPCAAANDGDAALDLMYRRVSGCGYAARECLRSRRYGTASHSPSGRARLPYADSGGCRPIEPLQQFAARCRLRESQFGSRRTVAPHKSRRNRAPSALR